jgi:hypothetical protein
MAGAGVDAEASAADVDATVVGALVCIDKGSPAGAEADFAAVEDDDNSCSGFVFSLAVAAGAVSDMAEELGTGGKEEEMGDVVGIETSLRGPCEPAPVPVSLEGSRLLNSMDGERFFERGCCALNEGSLGVEARPAPVVDAVASAIGRAAWGV